MAGPNTLPDAALLRATVERCVSAVRHGARELIKQAMDLKQPAS